MRIFDRSWDGETWPALRLKLKDGSSAKDTTNLAIEMYFNDAGTGAFVARRPGVMVSPKADGIVDVFFRGLETDFDGAGSELICHPKLYVPLTPGLTQATNLLLNPGFDTFTGTNPNRLPTSWTLVGSQTNEVFDGYANDTKPPTIFSNFWLVNVGTGTTSLKQTVTQAIVPGDYVTFGCWVRGTGMDSAASNSAAVGVVPDGGTDAIYSQFPTAAGKTDTGFDWRFFAAESRMTASHSTVDAQLFYSGQPSAGFRFDESNLFIGRYGVKWLEPFRIKVRPRMRVVKTGGNLISGIGSFERDSDLDGLPDGWMHGLPWSGVTPSMEKNPANVHGGDLSLKLVMASSNSSAMILTEKRGHFKKNEIWAFSVWAKTAGAMSSQGSIAWLSDELEDGQRTAPAATLTGTNLPTWTKLTSQGTLNDDTSKIQCRISVASITSGTLYLDDAELTRIGA